MSLRRRLPRALATGLLLVAALLVPNEPAAAQPAPPVVTSLVSISPQVRANEPLRIELQAPGAALTDLVRISIFVRETRVRVRQIVDGTVTPTRVDYNPIAKRVSEVIDPARQTLVLSIANDLLPQTPGVYPVQVTVGSSKPITTWLVRVGPAAPGDTPYSVSVVVPVRSPTANQPDGTIDVTSAERARLDDVATALETAPAGSVTVVANPETLDALDASGPDARATLEHVQRASRSNLVLGSSYVPIDIDAWRRAGREDHVALQLRLGRDVTARTLGRNGADISSGTVVLGPFDTPDSLDSLRREGAANVVVPDTMVEPARADAFPSPFAQTFRIRDSANQDLLAASADTWLADAVVELERPERRGAVVQQLLADLAAAFFDRPNVARGSVILLPANWSPGPKVAESFVKPLGTSSVIQLRDLDGFFTTVSRSNPEGEARIETLVSGPMRRALVPTRGPDVNAHAAAVDGARAALASYAAVFGPTAAPRVAVFDKLLITSSDVRLPADQRQAYVDATTQFVDGSLHTRDGRAGITVPESERITLTSRRETIRLVVENQLGASANVRIDLRSEKLAFPSGASITTTLQPGANTIAFDVTVKTSGDSLLEYTVNAPQGSVGELTKGKLRVRSIALSGLGVVLSALAVLVLATWWIRHGVRARRERRMASSAT